MLFSLLLFLFGLNASAVPLVGGGDACMKWATGDAFWDSKSPLLVPVGRASFPMSFSFDSEVPMSSLMPWMLKVPGMKNAIGAKITSSDTVDIPRMMVVLKMSEPQVRRFALRPGLSPDQKAFSLSDVNPSYIPELFYWDDNNDLIEELVPLWSAYMRSLNLAIVADRDSSMLEFRHASYSISPAGYRGLLAKFDSMFKERATHYHLGIPSAIGKAQSMAIARAVETRIVLSFAKNWNTQTEPANQSFGTTLRQPQRVKVFIDDQWLYEIRGFVRFQYGEWTMPHSTDNLEIRQATSRAQAFELLAMASRMAADAGHLRILPDSVLPVFINDLDAPSGNSAYVGNVAGALAYGAEILRYSTDPSDRALADPMAALAKKADRAFAIQQEDLVKPEVVQFLSKNKIDQRLSIDKFFVHEAAP